MKSINDNRYDNLSEAVAFVIDFDSMVYSYGDVGWDKYETEVCSRCHKMSQFGDFLAPKTNCKKAFGLLQSYYFGVNEELRNELIRNFNIMEEDFRPVRNKSREIVFYQITPRHKMLPIASVNRIKALKPCKKCGSVQHRIKEFKNNKGNSYYFITIDVLEDLQDINQTVEEFDMFIPLYVVSRKVYDYLSEKYPRMRFEPIFLNKNQEIKLTRKN